MVQSNDPVLGDSLYLRLQAHPGTLVPTAITGSAAYRIYGPGGTTIMTNGSGSYGSTVDSQTGFFAATVSITAADGYASGSTYVVRSTWVISGTTYSHLHRFYVL